MFSRYARERCSGGEPVQLSVVDVKKSDFHNKPQRSMVMAPPKELGLPKSLLARQMKGVYGRKVAGMF